MKIRNTLLCTAVILASASSVLARNPDPKRADPDCAAYVNKHLAETNGRIDSLKTVANGTAKRVESLENELKSRTKEIADQKASILMLQMRPHQKAKINELTEKLNETRKLLDKNLNDIEKLRGGTERTGHRVRTILLLLVPIAAIVLLFAVFFFWPRNRAGQTTASVEPGARPKCPRCGWEHDPADTVCKNPACKVQF